MTRHYETFYYFFPENRFCHFYYSKLSSEKNKNKYPVHSVSLTTVKYPVHSVSLTTVNLVKVSSAGFAYRVVKFKHMISRWNNGQ